MIMLISPNEVQITTLNYSFLKDFLSIHSIFKITVALLQKTTYSVVEYKVENVGLVLMRSLQGIGLHWTIS